MWLEIQKPLVRNFSMSPKFLSLQAGLPESSFRYLSSLSEKARCFALENSLRQLSGISGFLPMGSLTSQLTESSRTFHSQVSSDSVYRPSQDGALPQLSELWEMGGLSCLIAGLPKRKE
jgi:hypothetical protein